MAERAPKIGDWVRWHRFDTGLTIGVVMYLREQMAYPYGIEAVTDAGVVACADILEIRSAGAAPKGEA